MWFRIGIRNFIAKTIIHDDCYELYLCDFARIWHTSLSNGELVSISKALNPLFETSVQKLKDIISNLFQDENAEKEVTEINNSITLKLKSNSLGVKFQFQILLYQQNEEIMQHREEQLVKIITDKDVEIKEYKQEYGVIKSCFVATEPFNKEEFESQESVTDICNINSFFECINLILPKVNKEQSSYENLSGKHVPGSSQKFINDNKKTAFRGKNTTSGPNQCVRLEHQTIKRRKKQTDAHKIKF